MWSSSWGKPQNACFDMMWEIPNIKMIGSHILVQNSDNIYTSLFNHTYHIYNTLWRDSKILCCAKPDFKVKNWTKCNKSIKLWQVSIHKKLWNTTKNFSRFCTTNHVQLLSTMSWNTNCLQLWQTSQGVEWKRTKWDGEERAWDTRSCFYISPQAPLQVKKDIESRISLLITNEYPIPLNGGGGNVGFGCLDVPRAS